MQQATALKESDTVKSSRFPKFSLRNSSLIVDQSVAAVAAFVHLVEL